MNYVWKRLSAKDVDRIAKNCNLEPIEREIIELLRTGNSYAAVAYKVGYSFRSIERHSKRIFEKIRKEL